MNMTKLKVAATIIIASLSLPTTASAYEIFEGDKRTACEVILCLAAGEMPHECIEPLKRYFSIKFRKPWKTFRARKNFLKLCPNAEDNMLEGDYDLLAEFGGRCTGEGKQNFINGQGSTYLGGRDETQLMSCRWNENTRYFANNMGQQCDSSTSKLPYSTKVQLVDDICRSFNDSFSVNDADYMPTTEIGTPQEAPNIYFDVKRCHVASGSEGNTLDCTVTKIMSNGRDLPQPSPMPERCRNTTDLNGCSSVEITYSQDQE